MFKLVVVGGPTKGQSYQVKEGENSIGRVGGNDIVLQSQKVSKKHCVLVVNNKDITVKDAGSSNGTFVNGVLTKLKKLAAGDRVSVGEYVLEIRAAAEAAKPMPMLSGAPVGGNVLPFPGGSTITGAINVGAAGGAGAALPKADAPPANLQEKVKFYFEKYILNFVYNLNEKHEWNVMMAGMFGVLTVAAAILAVYPVLDRVNAKLQNEAAQRALLLARQIVERNAGFVYERMEARTEVSFVEKEPGVKGAYLVDMEGRVMAPGRKINQYLNDPTESAFGSVARAAFANKDSLERLVRTYGDIVAVAVPLKLFNQANGRNVSVALSLVFFDRGLITLDSGTEALIYIQATILIAIVAVIIFFSLYRLTLRPLTALNDDIDTVLKGNAIVVEKKFKMQEIEPLLDIVNAALQRASGGGASGAGAVDNSDDVVNMLRFAGARMSSAGMLLFSADKRILYVSPFMEEIAGFRNDSSVGSEISGVARDAAFISFVDDMLARAPLNGGEPVADDFEFSGTSYRLECMAYGTGGVAKVYAITATKAG